MPESYRKGLEQIAAIDPENGPIFVKQLEEFSPDFAEFFVGTAYGQIQARKVLEPKVKELIAIASLIGLGDGKSHLRLHFLGACNAGCTKEEIIEVIIQSVVYVGFTKAIAALYLLKEAWEECPCNPDSKGSAKS